MMHEWNREAWQRLATGIERLPHALLLQGRAGLGKDSFALHLAHALLCERVVAGGACGQCRNCRLLAAGNHPDLQELRPAEEGKAILIDQVRALGEFLTLRPHTSARKVVIVSPAEAMNTYAANSLLKLLEEPPAASHLLLVSHQMTRLPATIRSRCARVDFYPPSAGTATAWLAQEGVAVADIPVLLESADGAPLRALRLAHAQFPEQRRQFLQDMAGLAGPGADPVTCAARWKKAGAELALGWLQGLVADLVRLGSGASGGRLFNPDARPQLQGYANRLHLKQLCQFLEVVSRNKALLRESLDELLLVEDSLIHWVKLMRQSS
jgi:DNA polymerase-3 subunit delta'